MIENNAKESEFMEYDNAMVYQPIYSLMLLAL